MLVYSNGDSAASVGAVTIFQQPKLSFSNVACHSWTGTSKVTVTDPFGATTRFSARVTFELDEELSEFDLYGRSYKVLSGTATVEGQSGPEGRRSTYSLNSGSIAERDGRLQLRLVPT